MKGFKHRKRTAFAYASPWQMYADRKNRKIQSLYDHQTQMLKQYMQAESRKDISLELPTGSGKTLVGLLIGDFRRQKNKERVVYLCVNNALVDQVCKAANEQYGIDARPFVGKKSSYSEKDKIDYNSAKCIAVTSYSSLFNVSPFFNDAEVLIFDDAHSAGSMVANQWSLRVGPNGQHADLFADLIRAIKPLLSEKEVGRLSTGEKGLAFESIVGCIPSPALDWCQKELGDLLNKYVSENPEEEITFPIKTIKDNLQGCSVFLSSDEILIRPLIPPTKFFAPMEGAKQRLYMSATIGETGELERLFGRDSIYALPPLEEWDGRTTGRRLFMFPAAIEHEPKLTREDLLKVILEENRRALIITDTLASQAGLRELLQDKPNVYCASNLKRDKDDFLKTEDGILIAANRLDGMDFPSDDCRIEVIYNLPRGIDLQERFFVSMVQARELYSERLRNRLTQALGRCTRSQTDYSVVYILDNLVKDEITAPELVRRYNYELQAEIEFALDNLEGKTLEEYLELATIFLTDRDAWEDFDQDIVEARTEIADNDLVPESMVAKALKKAASIEVQISQSLWDGDYQSAISKIRSLLVCYSDDEDLAGYGAFWNYVLYYCSRAKAKDRGTIDGEEAQRYLDNAKEGATSASWIIDRLPNKIPGGCENPNVLDRLTKKIKKAIRNQESRRQAIEQIDAISERLGEAVQKDFEAPHTDLGDWLGYLASNPSGDAEPDPYWVIDSKSCIVSEDKIYEDKSKAIPVRHVREAAGHKKWVQEKLTNVLDKDAVVDTVFITNAVTIDENAAIQAEDIWYVTREEFVEWGVRALQTIRNILSCVDNGEADLEQLINQKLVAAEVSSTDFLKLIKRKKLKNLKRRNRSGNLSK